MGCFILITRPHKICDCCRKPVAEKVCFCFWKNICGYTTIRKTDIITTVDPVDGIPCTFDATTDLHYCKDCWNAVVKNLAVQEDWCHHD